MGDNKLIGTGGEYFATSILYSQGFDILDKNFKCRFGEIDIICRKNNCIYFVEVKTRTGLDCGIPSESVDYNKQCKIRGVAQYYMMTHGFKGMKMSFQVFEIYINQILNAF